MSDIVYLDEMRRKLYRSAKETMKHRLREIACYFSEESYIEANKIIDRIK